MKVWLVSRCEAAVQGELGYEQDLACWFALRGHRLRPVLSIFIRENARFQQLPRQPLRIFKRVLDV